MCTTDIYPFISADGIHRENREIRRCTAYRRGIPCDPIVFKHPLGHHPPTPATPTAPVDIPGASPRFNSQGVYFPPSPRLTPGQTTPATTHESDSDARSGASSSASREKRHRYRRPSILINGQDMVNVETEPSRSGHRRRTSSSSYHKEDTKKGSSSNTRIIIVEAPPTPRTPPQSFDIPRTAPPSPSYISGPLGQDPALRHRPVIVDERPRPQKDSKPRVRIEVPGEESYSSPSSSSPSPSRGGHHRRQPSDSSYHSRGSSSHPHSHSHNTASDEEKRRRRKEKKEQREEAKDEAWRQRQEARIARANRNIADRPTQPIPSRRPTSYVRPTVEIHPSVGAGMTSSSAAGPAGLVDPFTNLGLGWGGAPAPGQWAPAPRPAPVMDEEEDEEAQKERLKERWMPRRRATIGAGSRRHRVEYQDGLYRLE